jgi:hypothetical protein
MAQEAFIEAVLQLGRICVSPRVEIESLHG